ncbi:CaM kinase-like vesicle-associated protein 1G5z [Collichthys lucidus]|uniref:CaM kinase-like vesicle-associated protein n=1 Tax=Collichthys lucidus TaxID=240159 RepID=A0A4U5UB56_COLLU|nr:CaM kinase-like vesicle-associated protein 1G5z [Collichthys lucidus]
MGLATQRLLLSHWVNKSPVFWSQDEIVLAFTVRETPEVGRFGVFGHQKEQLGLSRFPLGGSSGRFRSFWETRYGILWSGVAMPFGCLTIGEKKDYNNPSDVTDKYDLGQIVKSEEFCEIFRAKDKTTMKMYTCKKFLKKDGRKVRKAAKNEILILKIATGREVFDWILDQGYYSERDTSNVVRQVLEAVAYLHSLHIVHRNLKLENLVYYNRLKHSKIVISDFHLAKLENGLIKDPCGTPEYLAPEVVGRQRYGRPVDCWATGVIMYILLSGNPPFYDETDDDDYENHDKNLFRKILAGDYEFDSPYWDDISDSAKSLVARLMEVDQDQRLTAQEAINHEWISGGAASDKNIKENVCAQIEKNFARAKWKKAVRVTTIMKRLRAPEQSPAAGAPADTAAPQAAADSSAPSSAATLEGLPAAVTELPAGAEISQLEVGAGVAAAAAEPQHPQGAEPTSRCNGEATTALNAASEGGVEQG